MSIGSRPVYVDVASRSFNMDPEDLASKIGSGTKAIVVQHSYGLPADILRIAEIARERGIPLIEDCAHTICSAVGRRLVGSFGEAAFYSYEAAKPLFVGIGGSAVINNPRLTDALAHEYPKYKEPNAFAQLEAATMVRAHRLAYRPSTYWTVRSLFRSLSALGVIRGNYNKLGNNARPAADFERRMGGLQRNQLHRELAGLVGQTAHRRRVAAEYRQRIQPNQVSHPVIPAGVDAVFSRYPMFVEDKRNVLEGARRARVELAGFYDSAVQPLQGAALSSVGYEPGSCPNAEWAAERIVSLPTGLLVGEKQIDRAVDFFNGRGVVAEP